MPKHVANFEQYCREMDAKRARIPTGYIGLFEAITFIAFGEPIDSHRLFYENRIILFAFGNEFLRLNDDQRARIFDKSAYVDDLPDAMKIAAHKLTRQAEADSEKMKQFELAWQTLRGALARGELVAFGRSFSMSEARKVHDDLRLEGANFAHIPAHYFLHEVKPSTNGTDGLGPGFGADPSERMDTAWADVRLVEVMLKKRFGPTAKLALTARAETECYSRLKKEMEQSPSDSRLPKSQWHKTLSSSVSGLSERAFNRAWDKAVQVSNSNWKSAGRKRRSKSPH